MIKYKTVNDEIKSLKNFLSQLVINDNTYKNIINTLLYFEENCANGFKEEIVELLNGLDNFKNFKTIITTIKNRTQKHSINNDHYKFIMLEKEVDKYVIDGGVDFSLWMSSKTFYIGDSKLYYPIIEYIIRSDLKLLKKSLFVKDIDDFIAESYEIKEKSLKNLSQEDLEKRINENLTLLSKIIIENLNYEYEDISWDKVNKLPNFFEYYKYFLIKGNINEKTYNVVKNNIEKIAEYEKILLNTADESKKKEMQALFNTIFNSMININKLQSKLIMKQDEKSQDLYNFIVEKLPNQVIKKQLGNKNVKNNINIIGLENQLNLIIEMDLKEFTKETGFTKELITNFFKYYTESDIYKMQSKNTIKIGFNYNYDVNKNLINKDFFKKRLATIIVETLIYKLSIFDKIIKKGFLSEDEEKEIRLNIDYGKLLKEIRENDLMKLINKSDKSNIIKKLKI